MFLNNASLSKNFFMFNNKTYFKYEYTLHFIFFFVRNKVKYPERKVYVFNCK